MWGQQYRLQMTRHPLVLCNETFLSSLFQQVGRGCTLGQGLGQLDDKGVHLDACCPDACAKLHILLFLCGRVCDHDLSWLHLIHLHHHTAACLLGKQNGRQHDVSQLEFPIPAQE